MSEADVKLLVITNMGPKPSSPFQGQFVQAQVTELQAQHQPTDYHYMRWHRDSWLNRLLKYPVFLLDFCWRFLFSTKRYDILHVHFFYPTIWLALLYRLVRYRRVKIVVTCHGSDIYHYQPPGRLYRWCAKQVDSWVFSSQALAQKFFMRPQKAQVLAAGIHRRYAGANCVSRADKDIDLLYVGTLDKNKGMDRLIALLPALQQYKVVIAGAGSWRPALEQAIEAYPNVRLLGSQSGGELMCLYQRARCFISLSRNESFGLVMAEAMACYTPVVATETDGAKAQIRAGITGYCVPQQDEAACLLGLQQAVAQLMALDAPAYQQLQQHCRNQAEQILLPVVVQRLRKHYQELML
ncbi:group 1 glycosyl transferase [Alishewanella aestuarii B11]|uniref:Group 1 glycosyl transferase n=2 Tax=Alishewanella aestuarii TaxID=453835 RepID=J2IEH3_9ALTE|nr:glycosyltransferase family 4 protein [Alishewanella aestuarii]EJI85582.1 group 1 glycosyl transferase [Alishewanella aestuarii B11]